MVTETESLEALHLWLAERFSELRYVGSHKRCARTYAPNRCYYENWWSQVLLPCDGRGWQPDISTDALLEALSGRWPLTLAWYPKSSVDEAHWQAIVFTKNTDGIGHDGPSGNGPTPFEALCRAARKALEA